MQKEHLCVCVENSLGSVVQALEQFVEKDVQLQVHREQIGYVHRQDAGLDIYFLANISNQWNQEEVTFCGQRKPVMVLNLMDGRARAVSGVEKGEAGTKISLTFHPFESVLFLFGEELEEAELVHPEEDDPRGYFSQEMDLSRDWTLRVASRNFQREYETLEGWEQNEPLRYYSGEGEYEKHFYLSREVMDSMGDKQVYLTLEHLGETAEVEINGTPVGRLLMHPYMLPVAGLLKEGENCIKIRVENLLINRAIDPEHQPELIKENLLPQWPYHTGHLNQGRAERALNWRERQMIKEPLASGLWGKIVLKF